MEESQFTVAQQIESLTKEAESQAIWLQQLDQEIHRSIIGQKEMVDALLVALLADGHILMEGLPGLAKTTAIKALAQASNTSFHRIQFTPDLLPSDITGSQILNPTTYEFTIKKGPVFCNLLLADEINRAPAKAQAALLEAMQERQVTIGGETFLLEKPFLTLATQNPIEQEGAYQLPEAQVDRFLLKIIVSYPKAQDELEMLQKVDQGTLENHTPQTQLTNDTLLKAQDLAKRIFIDPKLIQYILNLTRATRNLVDAGCAELAPMVDFGASPRAGIALMKCAKAKALLDKRGFVLPQDVKDIAPSVLRHRIITSYIAEAEGITSEQILQKILASVPTP